MDSTKLLMIFSENPHFFCPINDKINLQFMILNAWRISTGNQQEVIHVLHERITQIKKVIKQCPQNNCTFVDKYDHIRDIL